MFGRKDEKPKKRRTPRENLAQFGFMDMGFDGSAMGADDDDDDDEDLEAELAALTSENTVKPKPRKAKPTALPQEDLDRMIAASLQDDDDDDNLSVDEDDPDLLSELNELAEDDSADLIESEPPPSVPEQKVQLPPPSQKTAGGSLVTLLEERLKMYQAAESNAKAAGETSRARRFARGTKTLHDQLKAAQAGRNVNEEDIPPPVTTRTGGPPAPAASSDQSDPAPPQPVVDDSAAPAPTRPAPPPPTPAEQPPPASEGTSEEKSDEPAGSSYNTEIVAKLEERRGQYRQAAVAAKRAGNKAGALQFAMVVKQFDLAIAGVKEGQVADLSEMPPPPSEIDIAGTSAPPEASRMENDVQQSSEQPEEPVSAAAEPEPDDGPTIPTTVMEALTQRLELYQKQEAAAKAENNSGKARRMGRIVKQYQDAIKAHRAGKPIPVDELPTPPGYAPIPVPGAAGPPKPIPAPSVVADDPSSSQPASSQNPPRTPPAPPKRSKGSQDGSEAAAPTANVRKSPASRQEKQLALLLSRQKDFKVAAMKAKAQGEINQAREYLKLAKGFDPLIEASNSGLPVDLNSVPVPPGAKAELESSFDVVSTEDCLPGTDDEIYEKLMLDLRKQIQTCMSTRDHFKAIGDVASANRFEHMAVHSKKDFDAIKHACRRKDPVPKFHYETRVFSVVQCCTDLMDNDLELTIVQGINYNVPNPKDVDTYVRYELPWPSSEEPQRDRTVLVKDTNNPQYDAKFTLQIQRNVRACQRVFKRHAIKCEVWSRGAFLISLCCGNPNSEPSGFLRSDTLIGTATIKLQPLETKCVLHDSFDLMEGRKAVGGKLEVKVRLRNPIVSNQVEQVTEKWLLIDHQ